MTKAETIIPIVVCGCFLFAGTGLIFGLLWSQDAVGHVRKGETQNGYWGPVASSVDWCEENYKWAATIPIVAEFHNSLTSFAVVLAGWIIVWSASRVKAEWRFHGLGHTLAVVGFGSVAFHGALLRGMQAADEVPMCWVAALGLFTTLEIRTPPGTLRYPKLPPILLGGLLVVSYLNVFSEGPAAVAAVLTFHCSFAPLHAGFGVQALRMMRSTSSSAVKDLFLRSFAVYAVAMVAWTIDIFLCSLLQNLPYDMPNPQLHAYGWHCFVALGSLGLAIATMKERVDFLAGKEVVEIMYDPLLGVIPYLGILPASSALASPTPQSTPQSSLSSPSTNKRRASTPAKRK